MAEHKVELGFKERTFKYTRKEREEFEDAVGRGMWTSIKEDVLALNEKGEATPGGKVKIQRLLVWLGLRHGGPRVTQDQVGTWLEELAQKGGNEFLIYMVAANAVLSSGVLGFKFELPEEEEAEGKEAPEPTPEA